MQRRTVACVVSAGGGGAAYLLCSRTRLRLASACALRTAPCAARAWLPGSRAGSTDFLARTARTCPGEARGRGGRAARALFMRAGGCARGKSQSQIKELMLAVRVCACVVGGSRCFFMRTAASGTQCRHGAPRLRGAGPLPDATGLAPSRERTRRRGVLDERSSILLQPTCIQQRSCEAVARTPRRACRCLPHTQEPRTQE